MASEGSTQALIKRRNDELALMPPPPLKRIKRPSEVLDEDDYIDALSDIIARDYYPGLREAKAQEEYLSALDSNNSDWIREAGRKLQATTNGEVEVKKIRRETRDTQFDTPRSYRQAAETPKNPTDADTPVSVADTDVQDNNDESDGKRQQPDTTTLSLSSYQAKYTSEDNASFNTLLDKQNTTRRQKHAYLWTLDQRVLSARQIEHRKTIQQKLITDSNNSTHSPSNTTNSLVRLTTGATPDRPAAPSFRPPTKPDNNFMFIPSTSVDEQGLQTTMDLKQAMSKAGPKEIVHANTRFPSSGPRFSVTDDNEGDEDDTTSIHTSFIARRNNRSNTDTEIPGSQTPRVNGYSFVDEDAPQPPVSLPRASSSSLLPSDNLSTYADTHNSFHLRPNQSRESLHHKLVEADSEKKRAKQRETVKVKGIGKDAGNMTPAARKLLGRLGGRTPVGTGQEGNGSGGGGRREDWTPVVTPRRERGTSRISGR